MSSEQNKSGHSQSKPSVVHVSVNTDEDWANLHAVVVDRMSFDAEVEKNKKLRKTIEELRFTKQDLRNTITKMQKALEKHSSKDTKELEATKEELETVKEELRELRAKYKELDEKCETCAGYLKEKEEQCQALRACRSALETIEKLSHEKSAMEQQLRSVHANPTYGSAIVQNQQLTDVIRENHRLKIKNQKLAILCKKLTKSEANDDPRENEDPNRDELEHSCTNL